MNEIDFLSKEDEFEFWRDKAENFQNELLLTQEEFQNYEMSSRELEQELELQLNDYESRNKNLLITNEKLSMELENSLIRLSETTVNCNHQIIEYQEEVTRLKTEKSTLQKYVRELEQTNDDLERGKRIIVMTLEDFEEKLNVALEKNAILENELEEKETLVETVQRLKEEARDLRQDLLVKQMTLDQETKKSDEDIEALATSMIEERNDLQMSSNVHINCQTDLSFPPSANLPIGFEELSSSCQSCRQRINLPSPRPSYFPNISYSSLSPEARISALNLVSDMLRKVGTIENKLTSATHRSIYENETRTSTSRVSDAGILNGFLKHTDNDTFDSEATVTPVASPFKFKSFCGLQKSPTHLTQTVRE